MCWRLEYNAYVLVLRVQCLCVGAKSTVPMCWRLENNVLALRVCLEYAYVLALKSTMPMCWRLEYNAYVLVLRVQCLCVGS